MARLRYVKTLEQVKAARESNPEFLDSTVRSIRCEYETDPALARAVIPRPLEPADEPLVCMTLSHVSMHVTPELTIEIGSGVFGVKARYDGEEGIYLVTMPMTTEQAVVPGRETFGEPKKIADIAFDMDDEKARGSVTRLGVAYMEAGGRIGEALPEREMTELGFCFKALPSCEKERDFDGDPLLVRLEWRHRHRKVNRIEDGEILLRESPFDPVADLPVLRIVRMEAEEGTTESNGRVLRPVPGEWLLPFLHQRYDDPANPGIEV